LTGRARHSKLAFVPLLSVRAAASEARRTLRRFPLVLLCGAVAAVVSSAIVSRSKPSETLEAALAAASLGLPLFVVLALTLERLGSRRAALVAQIAGAVGLVGFALLWPQWTDAIQVRRYAQINIGLHLLVAFLPYLRPGESNGFWQYNRMLFLRFLTSALYSAVLYVGLVIALVAVNQLFKARISEKTYLHLWIAISFVFNTWFFLGGVPEDLAALEQRRDYPRGLKVFSQFILIPLVVVYLTILTVYLGRVVITGQWPSGWIGYLVSSVAAVGMLSLLLVHPIRDLEENRWVATYTRWFYVAMLPAIAMLLAAIGKRIAQYGVTEDRYFIAVLALWLAGIAVVFIGRRRADIRWIPVTLCLVAFATASGPWGAYSMSRRSQVSHLRGLLIRHGVLDRGGAARPATAPVPFEARKEISSTLAYLYGTHGAKAVAPVLGAVAAVPDTGSDRRGYDRGSLRASAAMRALGMEYVSAWEGPLSKDFWFNATRGSPEVVPIAGQDFHVRLHGPIPAEFALQGVTWRLRAQGRDRLLTLTPAGAPPLVFPIDTLVALGRIARGRQDLTAAPHLVAENGHARAVLVAWSCSGVVRDDTVSTITIDGDLYLTLQPRAAHPDTGRVRQE
jgi:hypothetical protein